MALRIVCPSCAGQLNVKDEFAGRALKCPKCNYVIPPSFGPSAPPPVAPIAKLAPVAPKPPPPVARPIAPKAPEPLSLDDEPPRRSSKPTRDRGADDDR